MRRYWVIAPFSSEDRELFQRVLDFDVQNDLISIGWHQIGDISAMTKPDLASAAAATFVNLPPSTRSLVVNMLWSFYHDISPGDIVIARRGRKVLAAVGRVTAKATYTPGRNPELADDHANFLEVKWFDSPRDRTYSTLVFPMHTLSELTEDEYIALMDGETIFIDDSEEALSAVPDQHAFVLEKYLEDFIVSNFSIIFKGKLQIYQEVEGQNGQQYSTEIGFIDILAFEPSSNSFVVIELKKGRPSDQVIGQVLRYMGWVKEKLAKPAQSVKGLVICKELDERLTYALSMVKGVDVRYYSVSFALNDSPQKAM